MTLGNRAGARGLALASVATAAVLVSAQPAAAQSFTIQSGQTVNATQTMGGIGDVGIVEAGGTISTATTFAYGIESTGANATISNSGTISTA